MSRGSKNSSLNHCQSTFTQWLTLSLSLTCLISSVSLPVHFYPLADTEPESDNLDPYQSNTRFKYLSRFKHFLLFTHIEQKMANKTLSQTIQYPTTVENLFPYFATKLRKQDFKSRCTQVIRFLFTHFEHKMANKTLTNTTQFVLVFFFFLVRFGFALYGVVCFGMLFLWGFGIFCYGLVWFGMVCSD